jgi:polyphosphate kinase 2 (PPK2 family)
MIRGITSLEDRMALLDQVDLSLSLSKAAEARRVPAAQERLLGLRLVCGGQLAVGDGPSTLGPPVLIVFEGWDAAGKGGAISRLVAPLDPRHVRVVSYGAPTPDEKRHHFMQRFWGQLPGWGGWAVYDRSWYGRVLVERVEGFATPKQWNRAYSEIVDFETTLAAEGMEIIKFWLHISPAEQLRRFENRAGDPLRAWKLTEEDWRNRSRHDEYTIAVEEMLARTDHPGGRWHVVAADDKRYARVDVLETVARRVEAALLNRGISVPAQLMSDVENK